MELDFSEFHPLDHSVFQCVGYPGGRRRHLSYRWIFHMKPALFEHTLCALGIHTKTGKATAPGEQLTWKCCMWCAKRLSTKQPM